MWKKLLLVCLLTFGISKAFASYGPYSLGASLGDPTGLNGKYNLDDSHAIDFGFGSALGARSGVEMHSDYLWVQEGQVVAGDSDLDLYYGIGGRIVTIGSGDDKGKVALAARFPVGLIHYISDKQIEIFGEVAGSLDVIPSMMADLDLALGLRYRF